MEARAQSAELQAIYSSTKEEALHFAIRAAELYVSASKVATQDHARTRLRSKFKEIVQWAEQVKASKEWTPKLKSNHTTPLRNPISQREISKREKLILLQGSKLDGFTFPVWKDLSREAYVNEFFNDVQEPIELKLSPVQLSIFGGWERMGKENKDDAEVLATMVPENPIDLVQDVTTDCSVVASLCVIVARASKGNSGLLRSIIHPYNETEDRPEISRNGRYIFRLQFNGCNRKVTIDNRLPTSTTLRSLHVFDRNNPRLIWPALLEKAYLKVHGGYDFPGSNSGTDLWVIAGWIPEQIFLRSDDVHYEQLWHRAYKAFGYGDVMITLGTGKLTNREVEELGLAAKHDYAVLEMKEINSRRLLLIKNPWSDGMVWRESYSQPSTCTPEVEEPLKDVNDKLLDFSISTNGTFWMNFDSVVQHFESFYLSWNPGLFLLREDHHLTWNLNKTKAFGSFVDNPQYSLISTNKDTVWILLNRHFLPDENKISKGTNSSFVAVSCTPGYISLYIFKGNSHKVYLDDGAQHRGAFVDSPQTLAKLEVLPSVPYTLVVSQYGLPPFNYPFTLSCFSRFPVTFKPAVERFPFRSSHAGVWNSRTAGGNVRISSYPSNPQFRISLSSKADVELILETDKEDLAVHVDMVWAGGDRVTSVTKKDIVGDSGNYRRGCALAFLQDVTAGSYTIVCSTFESGQNGNFTLLVVSSIECQISPILSEDAGRYCLTLSSVVFETSVNKVQAPIYVTRMTTLSLVAKFPLKISSMFRPSLKLSLMEGQGMPTKSLGVSGDGTFSDEPMGIRLKDLNLIPKKGSSDDYWIVVERLGGRDNVDNFDLEVLSDIPVTVGTWRA
ncbi:Calpain-like cysteine protease [Blumeria graminis f. sp. tritici 96224]|uniref:Bgt-1096 n=2 Tax=Blumeria graminis f. sp. tritici TaxID=62690 RepID=A0A381LEV3_BLUGR|nr:Calpain-like cysteine protease [Blumeria graminis f. sp. tritici 96224]